MSTQKDVSDLIQERDSLIQKIKNTYPDAVNWLTENNIDLNEISKYSANIAIALSVMFNVVYGNVPSSSVPYSVPMASEIKLREIEIIPKEKLRGLTEEERAKLIWDKYGDVIVGTSVKYDLDPKVIFATIMVESGGNLYAQRYEPHLNDSSYGLGQILYRTARWIGFEGKPEDLYDPVTNIDLIGRYYKKNKDMYGSDLTVNQLVTSYNAGNPWGTPYRGHLDKFNKWFKKQKVL